MKNIKRYLLALSLLLGFLLTVPAQATAINWTLSGVTFDDGGTASGIFSTDSATGGLLSYDITTTAGSVLGGGHYFTGGPSASFVDLADGFQVAKTNLIFFVPTPIHLALRFANPLNIPGSNALIAGGGSFIFPIGSDEMLGSGLSVRRRLVTDGIATSVSAVPEPETYAMKLAGFGPAGFRRAA